MVIEKKLGVIKEMILFLVLPYVDCFNYILAK